MSVPEKVPSVESMSGAEKSLLLYLETRMVDYQGRIDNRHLNGVDDEILEEWRRKGYLRFGRIVFRDSKRHESRWVDLPESMMRLAWDLRMEKAREGQKNRSYERTEEKRGRSEP